MTLEVERSGSSDTGLIVRLRNTVVVGDVTVLELQVRLEGVERSLGQGVLVGQVYAEALVLVSYASGDAVCVVPVHKVGCG